jgi:DNA replication protein DnaC
MVTPQQARERGIRWKKEPPQPGNCEYCGKELQPLGVVFGGEVMIWQPFLPRCDCEKAKAHWEAYDRQQAELKAREEEEKRRKAMQDKINRLLGQSGIKKRFQQRTFPNFRCDTAGRKRNYDIAKEYADNFTYHRARGDGLYIEGTNGTGKTHLAAAIALQLINEGIPVICKTSSDLLLDIKKAFDHEYVKEHEVMDVYKKVDLLIIDDLGKEQCSDWSMSTLYSILNDRYEDMKPTIVTTNYNTDGLVQALTPKGFDNTKIIAIISRLRETSTVMTMAWEDIRGSI